MTLKKIVMLLFPFFPTQAQRQMSLEIPVADQQEGILKFLSLFDEARKSAIPIADPKISGMKGNCEKVIGLEICKSATGFAESRWFI